MDLWKLKTMLCGNALWQCFAAMLCGNASRQCFVAIALRQCFAAMLRSNALWQCFMAMFHCNSLRQNTQIESNKNTFPIKKCKWRITVIILPFHSKLLHFFPTHQLLKSKHYCKTILSTKKKNRKLQKNGKILPMATGKQSMLRACTSQAKKKRKKIRKG